jgi:pentatricopeptide repeat protein
MRESDQLKSGRALTAALSALGKGGHWRDALALLADMEVRLSPAPTIYHYSAALNACAESGEVAQCIKLLDRMESSGIQPTVVAYTAAIKACARVGAHRDAKKLIDRMRQRGVEPTVRSYNSVLAACAAARVPAEAFGVLEEMMKTCGVNVVSFNTALRWVMNMLGLLFTPHLA